MSRSGVIKEAVVQLANLLSFTLQEIAKILHISERTLQRYENKDVLSSEVSERAILLSLLYQKGTDVLGSSENFTDWLKTPLPAFEQMPPISFLDTTFGFQLVEKELGRIEHGVF